MNKKIRTRKGFTLIEAILVAILVGLLASIGIIKAADAKATVADNVIDSAVQDVNMQVQRFVIDGDAASLPPLDADGLTGAGTAWDAVLDAAVLAGYMTDTSAENLKDLLDADGATIGKAADSQYSVAGYSNATTASELEFYLVP